MRYLYQKDPDDYIEAANKLWLASDANRKPFAFWDKLKKFESVIMAEKTSAIPVEGESDSDSEAAPIQGPGQKKTKLLQGLQTMKESLIVDIKKEVT